MKQSVQPRSRFDFLGVGILACTLFTAFAHLYLGMQPGEDLRTWFLLNGLGYLALLTVFFLSPFASLHFVLPRLFQGYTLLTILLRFFFRTPRHCQLDPLALTMNLN